MHEGLRRLRLRLHRVGGTHAFLTHVLNALAGILHGLLGLHRLGLAFGDAGIPLGLFGEQLGFCLLYPSPSP